MLVTLTIFFSFVFIIIPIPLLVVKANEVDHSSSRVKLRILETTDIHSYLLDYDYQKKKPTIDYGYNRVASLINQGRKNQKNTMLFDVGDILKGSPLAEYVHHADISLYSDIHPAYKAMNLMGYTGATVGNHEFNFGLNYLSKSLTGANFPYTNANIYIDDKNHYEGDDIPYFQPYLMVNKQVVNEEGEKEIIKVGVLGLITPITQEWDRNYFHNRLVIKNMKVTAEKIVPQMKKQGADIIIALVHAGLETDKDYKYKEGNNVKDISKVKGIDIILFGHTHSLFPMKGGKGTKEVSHKKGLINGKPAVQAGFWGNHLGIIDLVLEKKNNRWKIAKSKSEAKPIIRIINKKKIPIVTPYRPIDYLLEEYQKETIEYQKSKKE